MSLLTRIALFAALALGACAVEDPSMSTDEREDASEVIAFHRPEAPTIIELDSRGDFKTSSHSIAFGHCDEAEEGSDGAINISCNEKWSELTWLRIPQEVSQALVDQGSTSLAFDLAVTHSTADRDSVRFSLHALLADGSTRKIATDGNVFDGETVEATLEASEYYVFMARGENSSLVWHNGSIEVDLRMRSQ